MSWVRAQSFVTTSFPGNTAITTLGSGFNVPRSVAVDGAGNVYVGDTFNNAVKEIVAGGGSIPASNPTILPLGSGFV
jgi:large repetitive protein